MIPVEVKEEYESFPFHVYHPNAHNAVTVLQNKKNKHGWPVCGWYIDTFRDGKTVKGLL